MPPAPQVSAVVMAAHKALANAVNAQEHAVLKLGADVLEEYHLAVENGSNSSLLAYLEGNKEPHYVAHYYQSIDADCRHSNPITKALGLKFKELKAKKDAGEELNEQEIIVWKKWDKNVKARFVKVWDDLKTAVLSQYGEQMKAKVEQYRCIELTPVEDWPEEFRDFAEKAASRYMVYLQGKRVCDWPSSIYDAVHANFRNHVILHSAPVSTTFTFTGCPRDVLPIEQARVIVDQFVTAEI